MKLKYVSCPAAINIYIWEWFSIGYVYIQLYNSVFLCNFVFFLFIFYYILIFFEIHILKNIRYIIWMIVLQNIRPILYIYKHISLTSCWKWLTFLIEVGSVIKWTESTRKKFGHRQLWTTNVISSRHLDGITRCHSMMLCYGLIYESQTKVGLRIHDPILLQKHSLWGLHARGF